MIGNNRIALNNNQKSILDKYSHLGLQASDFKERDWFNSYYHERAFSSLIEKKLNVDEIFLTLDKLNRDQAWGILQGLTHDEVSDLTEDQINAYLKYGIPKSDLIGLGNNQISLFLTLKNMGIKAHEIRERPWLDSISHMYALNYLMTMQSLYFTEAANYLRDLTNNEADAIAYGIPKAEVKGLADHLIHALIESAKHDGLRTREQVEGLDKYQINMVKRLYHFGLDSNIIKNKIKQTGNTFENSLSDLILKKGFSIQDVIPLIAGLQSYQVHGIANGATREEVLVLNKAQLKALITCRTIKNNLSVEDLRGKNWFDSEMHVDALRRMLVWGEFSVKQALNELDGLTGEQAKQISEGKKRDDIIGLTKFQLKALDIFELRFKGLTGSDLRGKEWFNSNNHVIALEKLVERRFSIENAINEIKELNQDQLEILISENLSRDILLNITPIQISIAREKYEYGFYGNLNELFAATWLKTKEQMELLKHFYEATHSSTKALTMLKYENDRDQVNELLAKINNNEIAYSDIQLKNRFEAKSKSFYESKNSLLPPPNNNVPDKKSHDPQPEKKCTIM